MSFKSFCLTGFLLSFFIPGNTLAISPSSPPARGPAFAQLSSAVDQQPGGLVQFESKDSLQGISAKANTIVVTQPGSYLIIASPQVTAINNGGCLDAWIVVNGQDIKNSGVRVCQAKTETNVVVSQVIMNLKTGDQIQVKTSGKNTKLDAITTKGQPLIPSIIFTVLGLTQ